jgi:hypothetical protein
MPKVPKNSDGAIMLRMAEIDAKLTEIARNSREGVTFEKREAKAAPLRKELAALRQRLWGDSIGSA